MQTPPPPMMRACPQCGAVQRPGAVYCASCGRRLTAVRRSGWGWVGVLLAVVAGLWVLHLIAGLVLQNVVSQLF